MKQKLLRKAFLLCALVVGSMSAWADTTVSYGWEDGDDATAWTITEAITKTNGEGNTGTYAGKINTNHTYVQYNEKVYVKSFSFAFKRTSTNSNYNVYVETSTDGTNWTAVETYAMNSFTNGSYTTKTKSFDGKNQYYVRFHCYNTTAVRYVDDVTITYSDGSATCETPTFTPVEGLYVGYQTVSISTTTEGATIHYTTDGSTPTASSKTYSMPIYAGSNLTVKAIAVKDGYSDSDVATAVYTIVEHAGTEADPYTVADARNAIDANDGVTDVYATGIVSKIVTEYSSTNKNITLDISADGFTTSDQLRAYRCKKGTGDGAPEVSDIQVGDFVVIKGNLTLYGSTYEFAQDNVLISKITKADPELSYAETEFEITMGDDSFVAPALVNPHSLTVTYSSSDEDVAVVDENTGELVYNETKAGTATITATFAGDATYKPGTASYTITIVDPNAKGSLNNPYTVAEVLAAGSKTDVYVEGYIVGYVKGTTSFTSTVSEFQNSNWALADDQAEMEFTSTIPVQVSGTSIQATYGLADNPELLGAKVMVKGDITTYFSKNGVKNLDEINVISLSVPVTAAGYATLVSGQDLDYSAVEGLKAYKATVSGENITFTKVTTVPAGEGVLLKAAEGTYEVPVADAAVAAWAEADNAFVRGTGAAVETGDGPYNYILNKVNDEVGFYKAAGQKVAKNRAYLQSTVATARIDINLDDETTGIKSLTPDPSRGGEGSIYTLSGQRLRVGDGTSGMRVEKATKGLYIVNGKKVVIK